MLLSFCALSTIFLIDISMVMYSQYPFANLSANNVTSNKTYFKSVIHFEQSPLCPSLKHAELRKTIFPHTRHKKFLLHNKEHTHRPGLYGDYEDSRTILPWVTIKYM